MPGTYGTISTTLRHLVDAEASYLHRLTGAWPAHPWRGDGAVGLDVLVERADEPGDRDEAGRATSIQEGSPAVSKTLQPVEKSGATVNTGSNPGVGAQI